MKTRNSLAAVVGTLMFVTAGTAVAASPGQAGQIARGKYLVTIGGCNDCHTPGYMEKGPAVPEKDWLTGVPVGFQGPWGTTYPANLRLVMQSMSESEWISHARQQRLPPMPWYNLAKMTDADLKAVYAYVRNLGNPGSSAPKYVAPGGKVDTPFFVFVPQSDARTAANGK